MTKDPSHVLKGDSLTGDQAMLNVNGDFSPNEGLPPEVQYSEDIVRLDHDSVDRVLLRDESYRAFSGAYGFVYI